jgi:hypothetical protein
MIQCQCFRTKDIIKDKRSCQTDSDKSNNIHFNNKKASVLDRCFPYLCFFKSKRAISLSPDITIKEAFKA